MFLRASREVPDLSLTQAGRAVVHNRDVFVALDVAKMKNAVAIADGGRRGDMRCLGDITPHLRTHES